MESFLPLGGFQLPFQRRLSRLYNDTKKSSDFVKEPMQAAEDPEIKTLHRKLRIQKDRLVSWGLEWSDPANQTEEIDESLSKAGLSDLVGSIMSTIKDILAEAEPLWQSSKRKEQEKKPSDSKISLIVWDKGRFEDLVRDLTASIDTLYDLSRTRSSAATASRAAIARRSTASVEDLRAFESTRIQTPQQIDPQSLTDIRSVQGFPASDASLARPQQIVIMTGSGNPAMGSRNLSDSPLLLEYAQFDSIYSATGITPSLSRFERLSAGLQTDSHRSPGTWIGLPRLLGYYEDMEKSRLALLYKFPTSFNPFSSDSFEDNLSTLGDLLSRPDFEPKLEAKFRLAHNLANTVFDLHARGITHGNLVDSSVSFVNSLDHPAEIDVRKPLVSSFDLFPDAFTEPPSSSHALYRHPLDPRVTKNSPLENVGDRRTLDLYSLAMLLVSIGLWTKLENLAPTHGAPSIPESVLGQLAIRCGSLYMKAVQVCWNAVDQNFSSQGTTDDILSQVQLRASRHLEACCILDGVSDLDERLGDEFGHAQTVERRPAASAPSVPSVPSVPSAPSTASVASRSYSEAQLWESNPARPKQANASSLSLPISSGYFKDTKIALETIESKPEPIPEPKPPKLRLYPQIALSPEIIEQWNSTLMPQINLALRHFYRKHPESVEISLESIGESPQKTTPTVLIICTSVAKVRAILMKKLGILFDGTTGFALKVCRGSMLRSRKNGVSRSMARGNDQNTGAATDDTQDGDAANPDFQERPHNGASIGAWIGDRHLPPVSFGGLILVDDKPYGMTVHHMLDDPDQPQAEQPQISPPPLRSSAASQAAMDLYEPSEPSSLEDYTCEFSDTESEYAYSDTDLTSDDSDDDDGEYNEPGDIPGVEPGCGDGYVVTQPALDDVEDGFYPEETVDEDHLDTFSLGEIYASSGIRRRNAGGLVHEIDWALFEFNDERLPEDNSIPRVSSTVSLASASQSASRKTLQPTNVVPGTSLPGLQVQCIARTSGLQTGQIMPALTSVKIYGRASPSHTYQVSGRSNGSPAQDLAQDNALARLPMGIPGDSGAWVIDRSNGNVCGHVLAWSERKQVAYICPMDILLLDIAETLEASEIRLPGGDAVVLRRETFGRQRRTPIHEEEDLSDLLEDDEDDDEAAPSLVMTGSTPSYHEKDHVGALALDMDKMRIPSVESGVKMR